MKRIDIRKEGSNRERKRLVTEREQRYRNMNEGKTIERRKERKKEVRERQGRRGY